MGPAHHQARWSDQALRVRSQGTSREEANSTSRTPRRLLTLLRVLASLAMVATSASFASSAVAQGGGCGATLTISPQSGPPGAALTFTGRLWLARCDDIDHYGDGTVQFGLLQNAGSSTKLATVPRSAQPDDQGSWSGTAIVDSYFKPGAAEARAISSHYSLSVPFTVTTAASPRGKTTGASLPSSGQQRPGGDGSSGIDTGSSSGAGTGTSSNTNIAQQRLRTSGTSLTGHVVLAAVGIAVALLVAAVGFVLGSRRSRHVGRADP